MDKIVDHLFVFRGEGAIEDFPGNYSDFRTYEDSAEPAKEDLKPVGDNAKKNWKQNNVKAGLTFNEQKEYQKLQKDIKDLERDKESIEKEFSDGTIADKDIAQKASDLEKVLKDLDAKTERWFELEMKME